MHDAFPLIDSTYRWVPSFVLAFARISALLFMFPYFGYASVSHRVRVFFGLVLTLFVLPSIGQVDIAMDINAIQLTGLIIKEIAIGFRFTVSAFTFFKYLLYFYHIKSWYSFSNTNN